MLSIQKLFINYNYSTRYEKPRYIVIHDVGAVSSARNNRDYFSGGNRGSSADFFVDSNNIIQIIDYHKNYSWAVGDGKGRYGITNRNSVSIEMCLESNYQPSEKTIQNTLDLTKFLMNELGISSNNVVRHYDASRKNCPQSFSGNNWAKWNDFKYRLSNSSKPEVQKAPSIKANQSDWVNLNGKIGYCTGNDVRVRSSKDTSNDNNILGHYNKGDKIELYRKEGEWYHIYYRPHNAGYISVNYVDMNSPNSDISKSTNDKGKSQLIKRLQQEINKQGFGNISVDGIPGNNTLNSCPTMRKGASGEITKILQEMLVNMGYVNFLKPYGCDGHFGTGTANAIASFQNRYGLLSDTVVGRSTWNMIFNKLN